MKFHELSASTFLYLSKIVVLDFVVVCVQVGAVGDDEGCMAGLSMTSKGSILDGNWLRLPPVFFWTAVIDHGFETFVLWYLWVVSLNRTKKREEHTRNCYHFLVVILCVFEDGSVLQRMLRVSKKLA